MYYFNKTKVQLFRIYWLYLIAFEKIPSSFLPILATCVIVFQPKNKSKYRSSIRVYKSTKKLGVYF